MGIVRGLATHRVPAPSRRLTPREREILSLLASGLSGAQIAERLVLSPDTVRTHIRNAMAKLDASTRSQAVVIALDAGEIGDRSARPAAPAPERAASAGPIGASDRAEALALVLARVVSLWDIERGAIYLAEDGLSLRRAAHRGDPAGFPATLALGEGTLGRAALERRTRVIAAGHAAGVRVAVPIAAEGRVLGLMALVPRTSRPIGQVELLLINALAARIGSILLAEGDPGPHLLHASERFRDSWIASAAAR